jgi:hypothetical protein
MSNIPAFPTAQYADGVRPSGFDKGMSLRDYFAAKAMQGMMSDPNLDMGSNTVATLSYRMADAMMKARET